MAKRVNLVCKTDLSVPDTGSAIPSFFSSCCGEVLTNPTASSVAADIPSFDASLLAENAEHFYEEGVERSKEFFTEGGSGDKKNARQRCAAKIFHVKW
uniref:Uncharacterized protein n=1 Tax=Romanomermis culicivorax TaxID=13658 RepID=A0A915JCL3_ROMCU